jgi:hypothetical protein
MFGRLVRSVFGGGDAAPRGQGDFQPQPASARPASGNGASLKDIMSIPSVPLRALFADRHDRELPDRETIARETAAAHAAAFEGDPLPIAIELVVRAPLMRMVLNRDNTDGLRRLGVAFDGALDAARRASIAYHGEMLPVPEARLPLALNAMGVRVAQGGASDPYWGPGQWLLPLIRAAARRNDPASRRALAEMFSTFFKGAPHQHDAMVALTEKLLPDSGLPRSAIPELSAVDARTARLDAIRERMLSSVEDPLRTAVAAVLDHEPGTQSRILREAEKSPAFRPVLDLSPDDRGRAFRRLVDLVSNLSRFGLEAWGELERPRGKYAKVVQPQQHLAGLGSLLGGLASRKIVLVDPDADIADFLAVLPWFLHVDHKRVLDLVLETARAHPHGRTVAALRTLVQPKHALHGFRDRLVSIEDVLRDLPAASAAAPASVSTPITGFGRKGLAAAVPASSAPATSVLRGLPPIALPDFTINDWRARDVIASHFDNLFEARLYDAPHRDFLSRLAALAEDIAGADASDRREQCRAIARQAQARGFRVADDSDAARIAIHVERVAEFGAELHQRFTVFASFVAAYPEEARALGKLAGEIAERSTPTAKWLSEGRALLAGVPVDSRVAMIAALVGAPTPTSVNAANERHLRALLFLSGDLDPAVLGPRLSEFALRRCYVTLPNVGIRAEKLGNACLWALAAMPDGTGVPYLARVLARTKYPKIKARIDAKLNEAAAVAGMSRATLDELTVPTHDLDRDGVRRFALGDGEAVLRVGTRDAAIEWIAASGRTLKAPSVAMKADGEALKAVKQAAKELDADLSIQPARLQRLYLEDRRLNVDEWRTRYLDHPLMRGFTRRLLWWVEGTDGASTAALPDVAGEALCDVAGRPVAIDGATIRLWHPIEASAAEVEGWRDRLEALELTQPFAQVWREVYALTDAERTTGTYSNRWAAHLLKQHQAMTLARLNGWRVTHRMWVDARNDEPWHLSIPAHRLAVDYWVEGAGGDTPEVADSGAYAYVATDRIQFHAIAADATDSAAGPARGAAVSLVDIPAIIFSEVMRHADLFTSVASIAADPDWLDRGAGAAHPNQWDQAAAAYWTRTNTADLEESGKRRRAMLERIVPRLRIADRMTLDDRHLLVQGTRHAYRIHLGSGACFRGERHICIVPATADSGRLWLPFEGDRTLSIILSKAMLLAADDKITDPVILRQL